MSRPQSGGKKAVTAGGVGMTLCSSAAAQGEHLDPVQLLQAHPLLVVSPLSGSYGLHSWLHTCPVVV